MVGSQTSCMPRAGQWYAQHKRAYCLQSGAHVRSKLPLFAPAVVFLLITSLTSSAQQTSWKDYLGGPDSSHYSASEADQSRQREQLDVAWTYPTGDDVTYTFSPLVIDNIAYFAAKQGSLVAVDASTGKELWAHSFTTAAAHLPASAGSRAMRGGNYWESKDRKDRRILVSSGGFLQAIDAQHRQARGLLRRSRQTRPEDWPRPGNQTSGIQDPGPRL